MSGTKPSVPQGSLFEQGYRCEPFLGGEHPCIKVWRPGGESFYMVDTDPLFTSCECKGFEHTGNCKHIRGLSQLLLEMANHYMTLLRELPPINATALECGMLHRGNDPFRVLDRDRCVAYTQMRVFDNAAWELLVCLARLQGNREMFMPPRFVGLQEEEEK